jgi:hypothetical protein
MSRWCWLPIGLIRPKIAYLWGNRARADRLAFPCDDVFDYEEARFQRLVEAYHKHDSQALQEVDASIKSENKTLQESCGKYQDTRLLAHEEKGQITDTRSAS